MHDVGAEPSEVDDPNEVDMHLPTVKHESTTITTYWNPEDEKKRWGRLSVMHPGPSESICIYCNAHGCSVTRKPWDFPSELELRQWLLAGRATESQKKAGAAAHKLLFPAKPKR